MAVTAHFGYGGEMRGDYIAAIGLDIVFQYFAIAPMRGLGPRKGLVQAAKAGCSLLDSKSGSPPAASSLRWAGPES